VLNTDRLKLETVGVDERIIVTAGIAPDAFTYEFEVTEQGKEPLGNLTQTGPDGSVVGPMPAKIVGSGNWTTIHNNPMLRGDWFSGRPHLEEGMAMQWGQLVIGCEVVIQEPGARREDGFLRLQPRISVLAIEHS
jgi:hypothetical protein